MKKFGYTLAEILIALSVIGIISALMIPAINNAKPDSTKLIYLKAYDSLCEVVNKVVNNGSIYSPVYKVNDSLKYDVSDYPLLNFSQPINTGFDSVPENEYKLANILKEAFNGDGTCTSGASSCTFITPDNMTWIITPTQIADSLMQSTTATSNITFYDTIELKIDENSFTFFVEGNGNVVPVDIQGQAYIKYRKKTTGKDNTAGLTNKTINDIKSSYSIGADIKRL